MTKGGDSCAQPESFNILLPPVISPRRYSLRSSLPPLLLHLEALHVRNAWAYSSPRGAWRHRERIRDPARLYGAWLLTVTVEDDRQGNLIASVNQEELAACVFRNTYTKPEEPVKPSTPTPPTKFIPQTGDPIESAPIVVSAVLGVAILAVAFVVKKRGKRN